MSSHDRVRPRTVSRATTNSCGAQTTLRKKGQKAFRKCQSSNRSAKSPRSEVLPRNPSHIADNASQRTYLDRGHILGICSELASGFNCSRSRFNPQMTVVIGVAQDLRVCDRRKSGHCTQMYGPPPNCKRFEVGRSSVRVNVSGLLVENNFSGHAMMIRTCRSY